VLCPATGLRHPNLSPVLRIRAIGEPEVVVAVAGQVGAGRLFAMSDPSAVMNQMLRYPGNRAFVAGLSRYLVADDDAIGPRQGRLFIVANRFKEDGSYGGETSMRKDLDGILRAITTALEDARREGFPRWLDVALAALAILGVAVWVARSSARPYKSPLPRYARPTALVSQGGVAGRFALIAAPTSPRSLALMELKSALFEAVTLRFDLPSEPTPDALAKLVARGGADAGAVAELREVLSTMQRVEAAMLAGRPVSLPKATVASAGAVVTRVLRAVAADNPSPARRARLQDMVPASPPTSAGEGAG
jgi:hypothetical protein